MNGIEERLTWDVGDIEITDDVPVIASANESANTGAMIALIPTQVDLDRLVLKGGEPKDELHCTLWFLGEASNFDATTRDSYVQAITQLVTQEGVTPVRTQAFGINYWNPTSDMPAWVLAIGDDTYLADNETALGTVRGLIGVACAEDPAVDFETIVAAQHSPWVAHVTIAYGSDDILQDMEARLGPITFDRIRVVFGDDATDIVLSDERATLHSSDGSYT